MSAAALLASAQLTHAADRTWTGGGPDNSWTTALNWIGGVAPVAGDSLTFDGFVTSNNNNIAANTSFIGITFASTAGVFSLSGNAITLGGNVVDNAPLLTETIGLGLVLDASRSFTVVDQGFLTVSGAISESAAGSGITKLGNGTLTLSGTNTFSGPIMINAGVLSVGATANLGTAPLSPTAGALTINNATLRSTGNLTINSNRGIALGPAGSAGAGTIDTATGTTVTYGGVLANNTGGTGSLIKYSFGTLTLSGANTYSGATMIKNGTVNLDFAQAGAPSANILPVGTQVTIGGATAGLGSQSFGALIMNAAASAANTQTVSSTTIDIGPAIIRANSGAGATANLNLGPLTHNTGGIVNFVLPASGKINVGTTALTNGILGGWATVGAGSVQSGVTYGTDWATVDGSGNVGTYTGYTNVANGGAIPTGAANNIRITGDTTATTTLAAAGLTEVNTILYNGVGSGAATTISIGAGNTLRLGKYGAIFRTDSSSTGGNSGAPMEVGTTQNEGILTAGGADNTPGEIIFMENASSQTSGAVNVEAQITDNGTGAVTVIKAGPSTSKLRGHNTYSGGTYLLQGRLQLAGSENGGTANALDGLGTGPVYVFPGAYLFPSGVGNFATTSEAIPNDMFIGGNGTTAEPVGAIRCGNGMRIAGTVTLIGDARIGGGNGGATGFSGKITGPFSLDFGAGSSIGSNLTIYNPDNDWTGNTTIVGRTGGTAGNTTLHLGASQVIPDGVGKGNLQFGNSGNTNSTVTLDLAGFNETVNGLSTAPSANNGNVFITNSAAGSLSTLTVGNYDASATFAGAIQDGAASIAIVKIGGGLQQLSGANSFTGGITVNGGTLAITGGSNQNAVQVNSGGALAGATGSNVGSVAVASGGHISPGATGSGSVGSLTMNSVSLSRGSQLDLDLSIPGSSDQINANSAVIDFAGGSITLALGGTPATGTYTILNSGSAISFPSGGGTSSFNVIQFPSVPNSRGATGTVVLSTNQVQLNVLGAAHLRWAGTAGSNWDLNTTANFFNLDSNANDKFFTGDIVTFDDNATNKNVTLVGTLLPNGVTVDTGGTYTFSGSGAISGVTSLLKQGGGTLIVNNVNTYTGGTNMNGGTLVLTDTGQLGTSTVNVNGGVLMFANTASLSFANPLSQGGDIRVTGGGTILFAATNSDYGGQMYVQSGVIIPTLANFNTGTLSSFGKLDGGRINVLPGGAVDVNGPAAANALNFGQKEFHLSGDGVSVNTGTSIVNSGALTNSGTLNQQNAFQKVTLDADASVGGTGRIDIRYTQPSGDPSANANLNLDNHTLTKNGSNQFTLVNVSVNGGTIVVNSGTLGLEATTNMDNNGQVVMNAGTTLQFFNLVGTNPADPSATSPTVNRPVLINGAGVLVGNNSSTASLLGSPITLNGDLNFGSFTAAPGTLTLTGNISETGGARALVKEGNNVVVLSGTTSSYTGATAVNAGTLRVNGTHTGGGAYSVASGATLSGTGTISAAVNMSSGATLDPGTAQVVNNSGVFSWQNRTGTLTVGSLSLNNNALAFGGSNNGMDQVNVTSANGLTLSGISSFNFADLGGMTSGTFTLIDYNGTALANLSNFQVGQVPLGFSFSLVNNTGNTSVDVNVGTVAIIGSIWNVDSAGSWSTASSWSNNTVPNAVDATANFGNIITAARTVTVDAPQTVGTMNFSSINAYTIGGTSTLTLDVSSGQAGINVLGGSHTISAPLVLSDNTTINSSSGAGVNITGAVTAAGVNITKAGAGTAQFVNVRAAGLNVSGGTARISSKGTPNADGGTSVVNTLSIASGGNLDLTNNSAVIDYTGPVGTLVGDVRQHLQAGRLSSSSADTTHRLGYGDNAILNKATFGGQTVDTSSLLIKFTFVGDANLDGQVDVTDLGSLATNWQTSSPWTGGDFNYDGFVDVTDLGALATNWQAGVGSPLGRQSFGDALAAVGLSNVSVPEPASISAVGLLLAGVLSRRSRRR